MSLCYPMKSSTGRSFYDMNITKQFYKHLSFYFTHQKHQNLPGHVLHSLYKLYKVHWVESLTRDAACITVYVSRDTDFQGCCFLGKPFHGLSKGVNLRLGFILDILNAGTSSLMQTCVFEENSEEVGRKER